MAENVNFILNLERRNIAGKLLYFEVRFTARKERNKTRRQRTGNNMYNAAEIRTRPCLRCCVRVDANTSAQLLFGALVTRPALFSIVRNMRARLSSYIEKQVLKHCSLTRLRGGIVRSFLVAWWICVFVKCAPVFFPRETSARGSMPCFARVLATR